MPTTTTTRSPLAARFGHEENLSRHIAEHHMQWLLGQIGVAAAGAPALEVPVDAGHPDRAGRLDVFQPTEAGALIIENQYGTSDSAHSRRFSGYLSSTHTSIGLVWIAESFRDKDVSAIKKNGLPVLLVQASWKRALELNIVHGLETFLLDYEKRKAINQKAFTDGLAFYRKKILDDIRNTFRGCGHDLAGATWGVDVLAQAKCADPRQFDENVISELTKMTTEEMRKGKENRPFSRIREYSLCILGALNSRSIPIDFRIALADTDDFWTAALDAATCGMREGYDERLPSQIESRLDYYRQHPLFPHEYKMQLA